MTSTDNVEAKASGDRILFNLKTRGPQTAETLARQLSITAVGVRQHLGKLLSESLVKYSDEKKTVGRPKRFWQLTGQGHARFPDTHAQLGVEMITSIRDLFGEKGLDKLIDKREKESLNRYSEELDAYKSLPGKVKKLAELRTVEGYMADVEKCSEGGYLLHESHCPICAAARECQGFCRSELAIFRAALGKNYHVERVDYLLDGGRRCSYRIKSRS